MLGPSELNRGADLSQVSAYTNPKYTIPEPRSAIVRRQRLVDFLHQNIDQPLQLISAPAGYGKTTLMSDFAKDTDVTVCWYSIDEVDRDPRYFAANLFEALRTRFPAFDDPAELAQNQSLEANADWRNLVNTLTESIRRRIPEYFVLIIDDFHLISSNSEVLGALDLVLQRLPDNCRIVVSTRELPQLATLPRLVSQRRVAGLGPAELRFTASEIKDLLKKNFDLEVSDEEAHRLEQESEGWITAILLTTHSLWKGLFQEVLYKQGENTLLYDYMASEVFSQQPMEIQNFLLATSIFNSEFDAELVNSITGLDNSEDTLRDIEGRNLFVTRLEGPRPWYRYHHLFRDFLREKLTAETPEEFLTLHRNAADYFVSKGDRRQAIPHYIQGEDFEKALDQLEHEAEALAQEGLWDTLGNWLEEIPNQIRRTRPRLLLHLATVHQRRGEHDDGIKLLSQVIEAFKEEDDHVLEAEALMRRSVSLRAKGAGQMAVRDARQALALAQEHGTLKEESDARNHLGRAYGFQGKLPRAEKELRLALNGYQELGDLYKLSHTHGMLGLAYSEQGEFGNATTHFEMAIQGWRRLHNQSELSYTLYNLACLYFQQGRYEESDRVTEESLSLSRETNSIRNQAYAQWNLGDIRREQAQYESALEAYTSALSLARECTETPVVINSLIGMGDTYRMTNDSHQARGVLQEALALAHEVGMDNELGTAYTSLGAIECESGKNEEGVALLQRACHLLERGKQKRGLARAKFYLAYAHFQLKSYSEASDQLRDVALLCNELGHYRFLIEDARNATLMIQYAAVTKGNSREFFAQIRDELNRQSVDDAVSEALEQHHPVQSLTAPQVEVQGFGSTRIALDGNTILNTSWGSAKAREMFLFMLFRGEPTRKDKIVEALWPHISPSKANANFHSTLHRMKSALYPECVERNGEQYRLNPDWKYSFDVHGFNDLLREAETLPYDSPEREQLFYSAIEIYQGTLLEEIDSAWCNQLRTECEFKFWKAVTSLADRHQERGEIQQSIAILENGLDVDELQEEIYYKVMDLYLEIGDTASATRTYKRCISIFGETVPLVNSPKVRNLLSHLN